MFIQGRFTIAAKHHITIAEIYESEMVDISKVSLWFCYYFWIACNILEKKQANKNNSVIWLVDK